MLDVTVSAKESPELDALVFAFGPLINEYVAKLELSTTDEVCLCAWQRVEVDGVVRKRISTTSLRCPVHSKEGKLLGFIFYLQTQKGFYIKVPEADGS